MDQNFAKQTHLVRNGAITGDEYFRATRPTWGRMARYLLRRWPHPTWVSEEDLVQELQIAAWRFLWEYEGALSRGRELERYLEWHVVDKAKKKLHKARGASLNGNADANPSCFEKPFSTVSSGSDDPDSHHTATHLANRLACPSTQFESVEKSETLDRIDKLFSTPRERIIARMLVDNEGDIVETALQLYESREAHKALNLKEARAVGRFVATTALVFAESFAA